LTDIAKTAVSIVSAYVSNNAVPPGELTGLLETLAKAIDSIAEGKSAIAPAIERIPAVPIRKSFTPSHVICLEDGLKFKSMKRHLKTKHGLTPEQYRERWNLPSDYHIVASDYSAQRSKLAHETGLGTIVVKARMKRARKSKASVVTAEGD
jgi:predicted transcriptional regulator